MIAHAGVWSHPLVRRPCGARPWLLLPRRIAHRVQYRWLQCSATRARSRSLQAGILLHVNWCSPYLASAGTGDVLAGAVGSLMAQGMSVLDAGSVGAHLHGRAAALSEGGVATSAGAVLEAWAAAVRGALVRV